MISNDDYRDKARIIQHLIDSDLQDKFKILDILMGNNGHVSTRSGAYQLL
jgi:muramidase (phage lysozyme)